ncbi:Rad52/Rad22 family DNA repair protein [Tellurirhabdus rosea]|uniref:Rad52/Rad22 family DNA repair protein n=1 Tax=Tellurirhabdus rosea TaxID=2674997 RepID=UPI00225C0639|nr:Rad52/Rad22 family DNA repair protein [Tellurirhabdus rosea]
MIETTFALDVLTQPIQPDEMEWRVQQQTKTGKLIIVPYITNRCVMERFDRQFGWNGWQNDITEIQDGFLCRITATLPDGTSVTKTDGANRTDIEPIKGGISDAMKRCAVQFGLGRDLYTYPRVFVETADKYIPDWAHQQLDALVRKINDGTYKGGDIVTLKASYR